MLLARRLQVLALSLLIATWSAGEVARAAEAIRQLPTWTLGQVVVASKTQPLATFFAVNGGPARWEPPDVPTGEFVGLARQVAAASHAASRPADIVVFLQESQFNPATIEGCPDDLCRLPLFDAKPDTRRYGPLHVHVFGGGTWLTEFALATGVPHDVFGKAGDFAPFNVAPGVRRSFVRSLQAAGYRTVAVYPTAGGMMNGRLAYRDYGFDRFYDAADLGLTGRFDTPDEAVHAAARRALAQERLRPGPVFLMVLTIFNHSQHGVGMTRVPQPLQDRAAAAFPDPAQARNVADYVWRTRQVEQAMAQTRKAVLGGPRPAVLAWFGDHQPPFVDSGGLPDHIRGHSDAAAIPANRQTWYEVASNVGDPTAIGRRSPLDIVFLPGVLAQTAGAPIDDWLSANIAARQACGGLLRECARPQVRDAYLSHLRRDLKAFDLP